MMNQHTATGIVFRFLGNPATRESLAELCHAAGIRCACPHRARAFEQQHRLAARPGRPLVVATKDSGSPASTLLLVVVLPHVVRRALCMRQHHY